MARPLYSLTFIPHTNQELSDLPRKQGVFYHRVSVDPDISSVAFREKIEVAVEQELTSSPRIRTRTVTSRSVVQQFIRSGTRKAVVHPDHWITRDQEIPQKYIVLSESVDIHDVFLFSGTFPVEVNLLSWPPQRALIFTLRLSDDVMRVRVRGDDAGSEVLT